MIGRRQPSDAFPSPSGLRSAANAVQRLPSTQPAVQPTASAVLQQRLLSFADRATPDDVCKLVHKLADMNAALVRATEENHSLKAANAVLLNQVVRASSTSSRLIEDNRKLRVAVLRVSQARTAAELPRGDLQHPQHADDLSPPSPSGTVDGASLGDWHLAAAGAIAATATAQTSTTPRPAVSRKRSRSVTDAEDDDDDNTGDTDVLDASHTTATSPPDAGRSHKRSRLLDASS